jgi:hypothetical protein
MVNLTMLAMVVSWLIAAVVVFLTMLADSEGRSRDFTWMRYHLRMAGMLVIFNCVATTAILAQTHQVKSTVQQTTLIQPAESMFSVSR